MSRTGPDSSQPAPGNNAERAAHALAMTPESLLAAVVENSDDAIIAKTLDGTVLSWNRGAENLFGWSAREMIGRSVRIFIPPERQAEEDAIIGQIVAGQRVAGMHTVRLRKSGVPVRVSVTVSPVRDAAGVIVGASTIARDVDALEIARQQLAESDRRFKMLAENISQLAWIADRDGELFWYNERWLEYTGTTLDQMLSLGWAHVHHPDHLDRVSQLWQTKLAAGSLWEDTFPLRGADGEYRWFLSRARPIRDEAGDITCWFGTNTDITEQRAQAESIQMLLNEVNHRSKNMLTLIQSLARRSAPGSEEFLKRFVRRLEALAANQDLLVERAWQRVAMDELARAQLSFATDIAESQIAIAGMPLDITARAAEVIGMALHELATNALKFGALSDENGRVEIDWKIDGDGFVMHWRESGGPEVDAPSRNGFGISVIRDIPAAALDAIATLDFAPDGLVWTLNCAADKVLASPI